MYNYKSLLLFSLYYVCAVAAGVITNTTTNTTNCPGITYCMQCVNATLPNNTIT